MERGPGINHAGVDPFLLKNVARNARRLLGDFGADHPPLKGSGVVIIAGGYTQFTNAWILVKFLRHFDCRLPVQLWHFGPLEVDVKMKNLTRGMNVQWVDALAGGIKIGDGWRQLAVIAKCEFEELLFLDAANLPVGDPSFLFKNQQYKETGALFWPDVENPSDSDQLWKAFRISYGDKPSIDLAELLINKRVCQQQLQLAEWLYHNLDDRSKSQTTFTDLLYLAWQIVGKPYAMPDVPPQMLTLLDRSGGASDAVVCQHDFPGERLFQHRRFCKWDLLGENPWVNGFFYEDQCRIFLQELRNNWNGRCIFRSDSGSRIIRDSKKELIKDRWLLKFPLPPISTLLDKGTEILGPGGVGVINIKGRKNKSKRVIHPTMERSIFEELQFAANGTLRSGANREIGFFWDIVEKQGRAQLFLSSDETRRISLTRTDKDRWEGHFLDKAKGKKWVTLNRVSTFYPHLRVQKSQITAPEGREILRSFGKKNVHVICSENSLDCHFSALYACAALCRVGVNVTFHTPYKAWMARVIEPRLSISEKWSRKYVDLSYDYKCQLRYGRSRSSWYAAALHPSLRPVRPLVRLDSVTRRLQFKNYILFAPYSQWRYRNWADTHWNRLANLLRSKGHELVALGSEEQAGSLQTLFGQTQSYWAVGHPPDWIMDALLGAKVCIGVDNEVTHLAVLLGVKCIAIHSQFSRDFLWPGEDVCSIRPATSCALCRFQEDRGYLASCASACSALATIGPEAVIEMLEQRKIL